MLEMLLKSFLLKEAFLFVRLGSVSISFTKFLIIRVGENFLSENAWSISLTF